MKLKWFPLVTVLIFCPPVPEAKPMHHWSLGKSAPVWQRKFCGCCSNFVFNYIGVAYFNLVGRISSKSWKYFKVAVTSSLRRSKLNFTWSFSCLFSDEWRGGLQPNHIAGNRRFGKLAFIGHTHTPSLVWSCYNWIMLTFAAPIGSESDPRSCCPALAAGAYNACLGTTRNVGSEKFVCAVSMYRNCTPLPTEYWWSIWLCQCFVTRTVVGNQCQEIFRRCALHNVCKCLQTLQA